MTEAVAASKLLEGGPNPSRDEEIVRLCRDKSLKYPAIAEAFGLTGQRVQQIAAAAGIRRKRSSKRDGASGAPSASGFTFPIQPLLDAVEAARVGLRVDIRELRTETDVARARASHGDSRSRRLADGLSRVVVWLAAGHVDVASHVLITQLTTAVRRNPGRQREEAY